MIHKPTFNWDPMIIRFISWSTAASDKIVHMHTLPDILLKKKSIFSLLHWFSLNIYLFYVFPIIFLQIFCVEAIQEFKGNAVWFTGGTRLCVIFITTAPRPDLCFRKKGIIICFPDTRCARSNLACGLWLAGICQGNVCIGPFCYLTVRLFHFLCMRGFAYLPSPRRSCDVKVIHVVGEFRPSVKTSKSSQESLILKKLDETLDGSAWRGTLS